MEPDGRLCSEFAERALFLDIEPYPYVPLPDLIQWIEALEKRLAQMRVPGLDFFRLDVDWVCFTVRNQGSWREVKKLEQYCRNRKLAFSLIYWASGYPAMERRELAEHWGYALEFGPDATPAVVKELDDPKSIASRICALAASDPEHYMGFLKCYYTAGMVGGVAGYFSYPPGGFGADLGDQMPSWLRQMLTLAHAQALFSHLEDLIRHGDLLPGPNRHRWVKDRPAYEFPTGDKDARVVARRHRQRPEWLLTAWAAGGPDREVTVEIPALGTVKLLARACGTVYRASLAAGKPSLQWVDENGMCPTAAQPR